MRKLLAVLKEDVLTERTLVWKIDSIGANDLFKTIRVMEATVMIKGYKGNLVYITSPFLIRFFMCKLDDLYL